MKEKESKGGNEEGSDKEKKGSIIHQGLKEEKEAKKD